MPPDGPLRAGRRAVSSVQSLRLFSMVPLAPILIRIATRWDDRSNAHRHG